MSTIKGQHYRVTLEGEDRPFDSHSGMPAKAREVKIEYTDHGTFFFVTVDIDAVWAHRGDDHEWDFRQHMTGEEIGRGALWVHELVREHRPRWCKKLPIPLHGSVVQAD